LTLHAIVETVSRVRRRRRVGEGIGSSISLVVRATPARTDDFCNGAVAPAQRRSSIAARAFSLTSGFQGDDMDKRWLANYPHGIPPEVDVRSCDSLRDLFEHSCRRFAELPAYSNMGASLTYRELDASSRAFGAFLQHSLGMKKGDRLAIMLPNLLQYPLVLFGALRAGLVVVNVNPLYTARELEHQLVDSGASAIVVLENFAHTLQDVLDANADLKLNVVTTAIGDLFPWLRGAVTHFMVKHVKHLVPDWQIAGAITLEHALRLGRGWTLDVVPIARDDLAFLQYTGGTTGVAKGVMLSHANMVANVLQVAAWIARDLDDGKETALIPLPLYHVYALTSNLVDTKIGAHVVLITNPRDIADFVATLKKTPVTVMIGVNTLYRALLDAPGIAEVDFSHLKVASAGGMAVQRVVAERWKRLTGKPLVEGYGLTETAPVAVSNPLEIDEWSGSIGLPLPSTEVAILDDDGRELQPGEVGEICVRGPQVTRGYWNRPDETAHVFTPEGWLRTGDMGYMDDGGQFRVTDRKKDMVIVSGFNVFPNEVEDVVAGYPGVLEVAAIGVPDDRTGEAVKIIVVRSDPALTAEALLAHCRTQLTAYKVPRFVEFRTEPLPKSSIGKILRRQLRDATVSAAETAPA
jgi:long-chain acyl-CoA synthetase